MSRGRGKMHLRAGKHRRGTPGSGGQRWVWHTACGLLVRDVVHTNDPKEVTCGRCAKSARYKRGVLTDGFGRGKQ